MDYESTDLASLRSLVVGFPERTDMLFEQAGACKVMGHTTHIVSMVTGNCGLHALVGDFVMAWKVPKS